MSYEEEEDTCFGLCMRCACEVALKPHVRVRIHVSYEEEDTCPCVSLSYTYSYPPLPPANLSCDVGEHEETYVTRKAGRG